MPELIINAKSTRFDFFWKFTKSETGTIDFEGQLKKSVNLDEYRCFEPSLYFTPSEYAFLQEPLCARIKIAISKDYPLPDKDEFAFFAHIPAVLLAMEAGDTLLVAELISRRSRIFEKFASLLRYIIEPKIVEIFFSQMFGTFYASPDSYGSLGFLAEQFEKKVELTHKSETIEDAVIRYFKKNANQAKLELSLPLVGMNFGNWNFDTRILNKMLNNIQAENLMSELTAVRKAKHNFYASLEVVSQIEPYNKADKNAIVVMIEDVVSKLSACGGMAKAGYIRRNAAELLRLACPEMIGFDSKLLRIYSNGEVVLSLKV